MSKELLTLTDAAFELKLNYQLVRAMLLRGELDGERIGSRWYVQRDSIQRFRRRQAAVKRAMAVG